MTMLSAPPEFQSLREFNARHGDVDFWWPYISEILRRHDLFDTDREPFAGHNSTHPTFICGDVIVKMFGYAPDTWQKNFATERAAQEHIATDPEVAAPRLLGSGFLFEIAGASWPYLISTRMPGIATWRAGLSPERQRSLAVELGKQVQRVHALPPVKVATEEDWPVPNVVAAAERSSLPPHLIAQIDDYLAGLGMFDSVVVNSDIVANHVYVDEGRFAGIIDWGDTMITDRHVEIIQIYRDLFDCDGELLRVFLNASNWPVDANFPRKALGHALRRQAIGLAQHGRIDVFMPIAEKFPLDDIATLDELANELFAV